MKRHVAGVLLGSALALLVGCGHGGGHARAVTAASEPHIQMISETYQPGEIRAAISRALSDRKFSIEKDDAGTILATYTHGREAAKVAIEYSPERITIRYVESVGMGAVPDASGQMMVDKRYRDLIAKLDSVIGEELRRPAKEIAAQAQRQADAQAASTAQARQDQIDAQERDRAYALQVEREKTAQARADARAAEAKASAPPPARFETQTAAPGPDYYWTPGRWAWEGGRYNWVSGYWAQSYAPAAPPVERVEEPGLPPSEQYFWVRGHWRWSGSEYTWVGGHWDTVRRGFTYAAPHWERRGGRWVHVEGRWVGR